MIAADATEGKRPVKDAMESARRTARRIANFAEVVIIGWLAAFALVVANSPKDKVDRVAAVWLYALAGLIALGILAMVLSFVGPAIGRRSPQQRNEDIH